MATQTEFLAHLDGLRDAAVAEIARGAQAIKDAIAAKGPLTQEQMDAADDEVVTITSNINTAFAVPAPVVVAPAPEPAPAA